MKILLRLILLFPLVSWSQGKTSEDLFAEGLKKYPVEKASVEYEISGDATGSEVFVFDRFGWRSLKKRTMKFELYGKNREQQQHEITDGKIVYRVDHSDSTFRKRMDIRWSTLAVSMSPQEVSESILFSLGGTYAGDSSLLDKQCQVWTFENKSLQEMWVWKGIALKRKSKLGELNITTTATKIETPEAIEEHLFVIPEIYEIKK